MKFAAVALLVAALVTGSNAITCYNATAMPDMEAMMFMLILGGSLSDYEPVLSIPDDAEIHDDCDACARYQVRMEIDTASFHEGEATTTTTASPDGWNFHIPDVKFNFSLVNWECVKEDPEKKRQEAEDEFLSVLGLAMLIDQIPGGNSSGLIGSYVADKADEAEDDDGECAAMEIKMAKGNNIITMCHCCDDFCNFHSDCAARAYFSGLIPNIDDDMLENVQDKCKFLRHAQYVIGEVCDYVDTYGGYFTADYNETESQAESHHMKKK